MPQRRVVFVIFSGFQALDLAGPHDVFQEAGERSGGYDCQIVASCAGAVRSGSGLQVYAEHGVADLDPGGIDTLVVTGGNGANQASRDPALVSWIAAAGAGARRVASVCTGVFLLAAAGLVAGRTVTTSVSIPVGSRSATPCSAHTCRPLPDRTGPRRDATIWQR